MSVSNYKYDSPPYSSGTPIYTSQFSMPENYKSSQTTQSSFSECLKENDTPRDVLARKKLTEILSSNVKFAIANVRKEAKYTVSSAYLYACSGHPKCVDQRPPQAPLEES